ncbi:zinc-dependent metalloprotease [Tundrisphaera sp. TA3]|uniref:zinc-dependent metalloprotease n=1 Tax=Tundrisphaera sp. TA3 TaxID=3435775 RepID=UPI003EBAE8A3
MMFRDAMAWGLALTMMSATITQGRADEKPTTPPAGSPANLDIESILKSRGGGGGGTGSPGINDPRKYRDFSEVTEGAQKHEGLFTLYQKEQHLYAEIKPFQFDQPMLALAAIARGMARAGEPLSAGEDEAVITFHRAGDRVQVIRRNIHYKAPAGSPTEKAVKQNYTDSILMALPIVSLNPGGGMSVVIDLSEIYFTDFAQVGLGMVDRSRTNWFKVNTFANNLELQVQTTFAGGGRGMMFGGDDGVADRRGVTMVIHYSLVKLPDGGYKPRVADDRVGHFLNAVKDFGQADPDSNIVRYINRWRLEKADPKAKLSPPKKQIVWYIEDTVPIEYRPYVEEGIREWNKAFEKAGFREAIAVRWQEPGRDDFDPEDINYCTFRWITTNQTYAMSCLRSNPLTGEMIDGDVIFDASWIKYWKTQYAMLTGSGAPPAAGQEASPRMLAMGEVISPILADKEGFGRLDAATAMGKDGLAAVPAEWTGLQLQLMRRLGTGKNNACRMSTGMTSELGLAALALADVAGDKDKPNPEAKLPEEFLGQMIKEVVMHEVGHSLGLRHNFKASTMLDADQLNDTAITRVKGQSGSVMDYNPINIVPKGQKQGDFITTTLGPYDYWVIEYAYKDLSGDEAGELKKIAARAPEHDLAFASDTDRMVNEDPSVNTYDLGSDTCRFAKDRITLSEQLLKDLDSKVVKDGESWSRAKVAFSVIMAQYGNAATLVASHIGGQSIYRDHKGDKDAHDPIVPIAGAKQREALAFLVEHILGDKTFKFSPALLRRLADTYWDQGFGAEGYRSDATINDRILAIQKIALNRCLSARVLTNLQNQELQADPETKPLTMAEVFRSLTDGIFTELGQPQVTISTIRRNLQREYLRRLATIALGDRRNTSQDAFAFILFSGSGGSYPADARSLARLHLREIGERIGKALDNKDAVTDDTCRAHLEEARHKIAKVLDAQVGANEP